MERDGPSYDDIRQKEREARLHGFTPTQEAMTLGGKDPGTGLLGHFAPAATSKAVDTHDANPDQAFIQGGTRYKPAPTAEGVPEGYSFHDPEGQHTTAGNAYFRGKFLSSATRAFEASIKHEGPSVVCHLNYGRILGTVDRVKEATNQFNKALDLEPESTGAISGLEWLEERETAKTRKKEMKMVVSVDLRQARGLARADGIMSMSDPFAKVYMGGQEQGRTEVIWNTLDPTWAKQHNFLCPVSAPAAAAAKAAIELHHHALLSTAPVSPRGLGGGRFGLGDSVLVYSLVQKKWKDATVVRVRLDDDGEERGGGGGDGSGGHVNVGAVEQRRLAVLHQETPAGN